MTVKTGERGRMVRMVSRHFGFAGLVCMLCSCGDVDVADPDGGVPSSFLEETRASGHGNESDTPIVCVSKGADGLQYRLHGNRVTEEELLLLMSRLQSFSESVAVVVAPDASVSADEASLVAAKIRAKGLNKVRVAYK